MSQPDAVSAAAIDYLSDEDPLEAVREAASHSDEPFIDAVEWVVERFERMPGADPNESIAKVDFVGHYVDIHGGLSGIGALMDSRGVGVSKVLTDIDRDHFEEDTVRVFFTGVRD